MGLNNIITTVALPALVVVQRRCAHKPRLQSCVEGDVDEACKNRTRHAMVETDRVEADGLRDGRDRALDDHEDHGRPGPLRHEPPRLPERARTLEAAGRLRRCDHDGHGADELDVEGEEVAQQEEEELHGEHHRAHVPEVEAHVKRPHEDGPPARDNVQGAAEHRGAERAPHPTAAGGGRLLACCQRVGRRRTPLAGARGDCGGHGGRRDGWADGEHGDEDVGGARGDELACEFPCVADELVVAVPRRVGSPEVLGVVEDVGEERSNRGGVAVHADSGVGDGDEEGGQEQAGGRRRRPEGGSLPSGWQKRAGESDVERWPWL